MAKKKSFVDKVYDAYIKSDYSYGDNNLNPKREIRKDNKVNTEDELNKILSEIEGKVANIKSKYKTSLFRENEKITFNVNGDGKNRVGTPSSLKNAIRRAGGNGDNLILVPGFEENYPNNLPLDIEMTIAKIIGSLGPDPTDGDPHYPDPNDFSLQGPSLFTIRCDGTIDFLTKKDNSPKTEVGESGDRIGNGENVDGSTGNGGNNGAGAGGGGAGGAGGSNSTKNSSTSDMQDKAVRDARSRMIANLQHDRATVHDCALYDLWILQVIISILKVIKIIRNILDPALSITVESIKLVVLAAQCWNNPTSIGEVVARIMEKIVAILVMIVAMLLQMLWNMLGLDCLTSWSISKIQEIKSLLAGINSIFIEVDKTALSLSGGVQQVKDAWDEASAAIQDAMSYSLSDRLKDMVDMEALSKNFYDSALVSNPRGAVESFDMDAVSQTDAYNQIIDAINNVKSLGSTAQGMVSAFKKMTKDVDNGIQQFSNKFEGIHVK